MKDLIKKLEESGELSKIDKAVDEIWDWGSGRDRRQTTVTQTDWHWLRRRLKIILEVAKGMNEEVHSIAPIAEGKRDPWMTKHEEEMLASSIADTIYRESGSKTMNTTLDAIIQTIKTHFRKIYT